MSNLTITNNDVGSVVLANGEFDDETLNLSGAQTVAEGTLLARDSVSLKLVLFVPGGAALKSTADGTFNLDPGDAFILDVDDVGNATVTFDAAAATIADTTTYTGGTAADITDTTSYPVADQVGLTSVVTQTDAVNGTTVTTVTFGTATTALQIAAGFADQVPHISAVVTGGQVVLTTDEVGADCSISVAAGTGALTWGTPTAGAGGLADQDGLTSIITLSGGPFDGVAQTVTFASVGSVPVTEITQIAAQMAAQLDGCSVAISGGQLLITHDGKGTDMDIAAAAGTGGLTWAASTAGTGDVADIDAVTATEVKTVVEADTTATVTVSGDAAVIKGLTELDFISGTALTKLGLSIETITGNENGIPKAVLTYDLAGANGDNAIRALLKGSVRDPRLVINDGSSMTDAIRDQLRDYAIIPIDTRQLADLDNQ
jgi:hypothetical protein